MAAEQVAGGAGVDALVAALDHPLKAVIEDIRPALLAADPRITEQVKWNAPSFCYGGDDRVTFNIRQGGPLLLIFHRGAKVKDVAGFAFADETGLMDWKAPDRAVVTISSLAYWSANRAAILALIARWMKAAA
jgi:hypothetical protein